MRKTQIAIICMVAIGLLVSGLSFSGCAKEEISQTTATPETVVVTETVIKEVEKESPFTFDKMREMAAARSYEGEPAKGIKIAFQNLGDVDFTVAVEESIVKEWELAGGNPDDLSLYDAAFDTAKAAQNHDIIIGAKPDVWIQFWYDAKQNNQVGVRAQEAGIPIIAVDIPVLGATFMGANNYKAGRLIGDFIVDYIENTWGGWDNVDLVTTPYDPFSGEVVLLRVLGPLDVLVEKYGESAAYDTAQGQVEGSKTVLLATSGGATAEKSSEAIKNVLSANPDAKNIVNISVNAQGASGIYAGADTLGRWDPESWLMVTNGGEAQGAQMMRDGIMDGDVAYFPENYGQYLIPAAIAIANGNPVPADILMDHIMLTPENLDEYYPQ